MTSLFNEYAMHHSSSDGVLVQLPGSGGFGRITKETLGGDALAERLLRSFASRSHVPALMQRGRDAQGYRLLTIDLREGWSELHSYPPAVRYILSQLNRKHLLLGLGTTTAARLIKSTEKGLMFTIPPNMAAVAAWEHLPGEVSLHTSRTHPADSAQGRESTASRASSTSSSSSSSSSSSLAHTDTHNTREPHSATHPKHDTSSSSSSSLASDFAETNNNNRLPCDDDADHNKDVRGSSATATATAAAAAAAVAHPRLLPLRAPHEHHPHAPIEVRVLDYNAASHVASVTARIDTVERTPMDTTVSVAALSRLRAGRLVEARVLLSTTEEEGCAVVEVVVGGGATHHAHEGEEDDETMGGGADVVCSVLGYYIYDWEQLNRVASAHVMQPWSVTTMQAAARLPPPVVGSTLRLLVEFVPEHTVLRYTLPFVVLSQRSVCEFGQLPAVRMPVRLSRFAAPPPSALCASPTQSHRSWTKDGLDSQGRCLAQKDTEDAKAQEAEEEEGLVGFLPWRDKKHARGGLHAPNNGNDEDEEEGDEPGSSATGSSNRVRRRRLEEAIDAYERAADTVVPRSPAEFQRLLLAQPNSSYIWTQYMAYHVGLQQYEDARQVAEKALHTMGGREEEERLNVWVAYLNVENLHGTTESLAAVFARALRQQLNPLALHERLADIYQASHKSAQLLALCRSMTSKFRTERRTWERLGTVLVDQDRRDQLKRVLKEMSAALRREEATRAVVHIAVHEYKRGSVENGRALLEGLLLKAPQQSDVWSIAIEQEMALLRRRAPESSVAQVRQLFERAVTMNLKAKVMQQFLTRFLAFERAHGGPADVDKVKERARAYVQAKIHHATEAGMV